MGGDGGSCNKSGRPEAGLSGRDCSAVSLHHRDATGERERGRGRGTSIGHFFLQHISCVLTIIGEVFIINERF